MTTGKKKKPFRRKRVASIENRARAQVYMEQTDYELIQRALEIMGEGTISGFAARASIKEAKRVIAEHDKETSRLAN